MMLRLRVKTKSGAQFPLTEQVSGESTLNDLLTVIQGLTTIRPERQKILIGFPPKPITGDRNMTLNKVGIRNGEVLIVEDVEPSANRTIISPDYALEASSKSSSAQSNRVQLNSQLPVPSVTPNQRGILLKKVVPSDNSCLFASVYYLVNGGGTMDPKHIQEMRQLIAKIVKSQPEVYDEAILEQSNSNYCKWILKETSWGGAIELSVLSQYYEMEIVAIDAKTGVLNRFGEDKKYDHRMIVMYDGIHYDPIHMETSEGATITIFPSSDESILAQAGEMALEAKHSGQFTDTSAFRLECKQCGTIITGEAEAVAHAGKTGHSKFDEVHNK